jgi:hypothetical protein
MTATAMNVFALTAENKMFRRHNTSIVSNPTCEQAVDLLTAEDFLYYDKDGFELNVAERGYYLAMGYPLQYPCLNHTCWQEPWFKLDIKYDKLILDHSLILHRANYSGAALDQLIELKAHIPQADLLIRTRQKWGFDFALDALADDGTVYEVLHIEYDHNDYDRFKDQMIVFDYKVRHTDWMDAARRVWTQRDQWQHLQGFEQNHWKSGYLIGWRRAEYTEKAT